MSSEIVKREAELAPDKDSDELVPAEFSLTTVGFAGSARCPICFGLHKVTRNLLDGLPVFVMACNGSRLGIRMLGVPAEAIQRGTPIDAAFRAQYAIEQRIEKEKKLLAAAAPGIPALPATKAR